MQRGLGSGRGRNRGRGTLIKVADKKRIFIDGKILIRFRTTLFLPQQNSKHAVYPKYPSKFYIPKCSHVFVSELKKPPTT